MSQQRWAMADKGHFEILEMQCKNCIYKLQDPMICKKFPERKPNNVLRVEADCPKFEAKK